MDYLIPVLVFLLFWLVVLYNFAKIADEFMNEFYKKKPRPKSTGVKCPVTKKRLKDFELFYGHCNDCKTKHTCRLALKTIDM